MITATLKKIEMCDFCREESPLGCTGVGPKTEVGIIEVMSICPRCRLKSLHTSIEKAQKEIAEYQERDLLLDGYEWEIYYETKEHLKENLMDLRYLVDKTLKHYISLYPLLIQPLNDDITAAAHSGLHVRIDPSENTSVWLLELDGPSSMLRSIAADLTRDLALTSYSVLRPMLARWLLLITRPAEIISVVEDEGMSAC